MIIEQPSFLLESIYPQALWRVNPNERTVYLTFDDGPIPEITPWVIDLLDDFEIKATFFLVGDNIRKHPDTFDLLLKHGHRIGNHTYNHVKGFEMNAAAYMENVNKADALIHSDLFRPPHGYMTRAQYKAVLRRYKIVMWDLVTRDYSKWLNGMEVFDKVKKYARNGSIITFHDSLKSEANMKYALPRSIEWLMADGYEFKTL